MMIDEKEIENFLSHHGVRGQKWGVRQGNQNKSHKSLSKVAGVGLGLVGVGAGALAVKAILANRGIKPVSYTPAIRYSENQIRTYRKNILNRHGARRIIRDQTMPGLRKYIFT